jgi:DNA-binding response OmpR family regulator
MLEIGRPGGPVLVVDDDWRVREVVQLALEECGFSVKTAAVGDSAIMLASNERRGVLVLSLGQFRQAGSSWLRVQPTQKPFSDQQDVW